MNAPMSAAQEWRQYWFLPFVAALGYSTAVLSSYGLGPFVEPLQEEFGWSRASISFGLTIVGLSGAAFSIPLGMLVDRYGPRRLALIGIVAMPAAFALLGTATGTLANWFLLWSILAAANLFLQNTIWVTAVSSRFEASRGMAMAITLSGGSLTSTAIPLIATAFIENANWRMAFFGVGGVWFVVAFPLILLFFRGAHDSGPKEQRSQKRASADLPGLSLSQALRTRQFYQLVAASGFYAFAGIGTIAHFVPILTDSGATPMGAAGIAALIGIFSLIGRLSTGFLLDRFSARYIGAAAFLLPVVSCVLLIFDGGNPASQMASSIMFGFTLGAEIDVIAYLAARHFGLKNYGVLFGSMTAALAVGTALGPLAAGGAFDVYGSYAQFLMLTGTLMAVSSVAIVTLGKGRTYEGLTH